ncbi:hypothetical protein SDC9_63024 [bioreactor metagenome]|uniref:Peptidase family U32 C-terminal domain-containing protein n=1 Tax=bioreactor metagenome TaxID=1076179 RepID=A0A644XQW2_9ZZZZ
MSTVRPMRNTNKSSLPSVIKRPELLAPAGDMARLQMAAAYGADSVYLAGSEFGMRSFAGNFSREELGKAVELCRRKGVSVYVACNTMPRNDEMERLPDWFVFLDEMGVDAAIVADVGVLSLLKKYAPHLKAHVSTQASVVSYTSAGAWYDLGAQRVILARELSMDEIAEIRAKAPRELELEVFVHGSMCVSYSGRCLLSSYMTGRDSNRGACAQPCRYQYALMEEKRPGEYFPVYDDGEATYIMNSRDLCMIGHMDELAGLGIDSFKIEGRAKSPYYTAVITAAYRHAIDAARMGMPLDAIWSSEVEKVSHRQYSTGFFYGQPGQYTENSRYIRQWQVVAQVKGCDALGNATLTLHNKFAVGDELELIGPGMVPVVFSAGEITDQDGFSIREARHPEMTFHMKLPRAADPLSLLRICRDNS